MKDMQDTLAKLSEQLARVKRYLPGLFALLLVGIYGFLVYRVNSLNGATPAVDPTVQTHTAVPRIDPKLISQLQSLQDNSPSVQTLFDQARDNPFNE